MDPLLLTKLEPEEEPCPVLLVDLDPLIKKEVEVKVEVNTGSTSFPLSNQCSNFIPQRRPVDGRNSLFLLGNMLPSKESDHSTSMSTPTATESGRRRPWACDLCDDSFTAFRFLTSHKLRHGSGASCSHCRAEFALNSYLTEHQRKMHPEASNQFRCSNCAQQFRSRTQLEAHVRKDHPVLDLHGSEREVCTECGEDFPTWGSQLSKHKKCHGPGFECDHCSSQFTTRHALWRHKKRVDVPLKRPSKFEGWKQRCPHCKIVFGSVLQMQKHFSTVHFGMRDRDNSRKVSADAKNLVDLGRDPDSEFDCTSTSKDKVGSVWIKNETEINSSAEDKGDDNKITTTSGLNSWEVNLGDVEVTRSSSSPTTTSPTFEFPCSSCDTGFNSLCLLARHSERVHHTPRGRPYKCDECQDCYTTSSSLRIHQRSHGYGFKCSFCPSEYALNANLAHHMKRMHPEGIPTFVCQYCQQSFRSKTQLQLHCEKVHKKKTRKPKPIVPTCDFCVESFRHGGTLALHNKVHGPGYKCPQCPGQFLTFGYLLAHYKRAHKRTENLDRYNWKDLYQACPFCELKCFSTLELKGHWREAHPGQKGGETDTEISEIDTTGEEEKEKGDIKENWMMEDPLNLKIEDFGSETILGLPRVDGDIEIESDADHSLDKAEVDNHISDLITSNNPKSDQDLANSNHFSECKRKGSYKKKATGNRKKKLKSSKQLKTEIDSDDERFLDQLEIDEKEQKRIQVKVEVEAQDGGSHVQTFHEGMGMSGIGENNEVSIKIEQTEFESSFICDGLDDELIIKTEEIVPMDENLDGHMYF